MIYLNDIANKSRAQSRSVDVQDALLAVVGALVEAELEDCLVRDPRRSGAFREDEGATGMRDTAAEEGVVEVVWLEVSDVAHVDAVHAVQHVDELRVAMVDVAGDAVQRQRSRVDEEPKIGNKW